VWYIFALDTSADFATRVGQPGEAAAWARAVDWFGPHATHGLANHTGAGIISLKYLYPLLDRFGMTGQGLRMQLQTDTWPSFGRWIVEGATTLWEAWTLTSADPTSCLEERAPGTTPRLPGSAARPAAAPGRPW
jgi:hypothetical protein